MRPKISTPVKDTRLMLLAVVMGIPVLAAFLAVLVHLNTSIRTVRIEGRLTSAEQAAVRARGCTGAEVGIPGP